MKTLITGIALLSAAVPADAANWTFNYAMSNGVTLSANISGTLQSDNNTILVDSVSNGSHNNIPGPAIGYFDSYSNLAFFDGRPALVTLDGAEISLIACESPSCNDGFAFDNSMIVIPFAYMYATSNFGGIVDFELYQQANWSMAPTGAVPEPASWAMLIAGFGLTGAAMRRRRVAIVSA